VIPTRTGTFCLATDPPEQGSCSTSITSSRRHWEQTVGQEDEVDWTATEASRGK